MWYSKLYTNDISMLKNLRPKDVNYIVLFGFLCLFISTSLWINLCSGVQIKKLNYVFDVKWHSTKTVIIFIWYNKKNLINFILRKRVRKDLILSFKLFFENLLNRFENLLIQQKLHISTIETYCKFSVL